MIYRGCLRFSTYKISNPIGPSNPPHTNPPTFPALPPLPMYAPITAQTSNPITHMGIEATGDRR